MVLRHDTFFSRHGIDVYVSILVFLDMVLRQSRYAPGLRSIKVSILVFLDMVLRRLCRINSRSFIPVSILVFLDMVLRHKKFFWESWKSIVSILVFLDMVLRHHVEYKYKGIPDWFQSLFFWIWFSDFRVWPFLGHF